MSELTFESFGVTPSSFNLFCSPYLGFFNKFLTFISQSRAMQSDEEVEGPACAPEERYNCAGQTVPQRDADDCSVFYNCDANIQNPCPSACPPGLLYNDILKICDWPTSVQC